MIDGSKLTFISIITEIEHIWAAIVKCRTVVTIQDMFFLYICHTQSLNMK